MILTRPHTPNKKMTASTHSPNNSRQTTMASIRPIPQQSVHRLVAGQAVFDLTSAVKELVENSIDAGATRVCVKLHDQGLATIQVTDNGTGVPKSCRHLMATKHATSKLRTFADLYGDSANTLGEDKEATSNGESQSTTVSTLGFRGEALFSLTNISKSLVVTTKTQDETVGEELTYDCQGNLIERRPIARSVGTTVSVHGLFERLPVRRADLCKKIKSHRSKLIKILQGYAILCLDTQFQWFDVNPSKSKPKSETIKLATSDGGNTATLGTRTASILGTKFHDGLCHISIDLNSVIKDTTSNWSVRGLISYAPASPHPATARGTHFFSINDRPVDLPKVSSLIGDVWKTFDSDGQKRPAAILAFSLPNHAYDVNLSPDKREVMFTEGTDMMGLIREELSKHWMSQSGGKFEANEVETRSNVVKAKSNEEIESQQSVQSETVVVNKITPRSTRKQNDDKSNASPEEDPLSSLGTHSNAVISPPAIQNQSESSDKENTNNLAVCPEQDLEHVVDNQDMSKNAQKKANKDRKAWEHMKLSFNRIDKSQQQKNMANLLSQANDNEAVNASGRVSADSSARKRSFLEQFAFKSTVSEDSRFQSCKDSITEQPSLTEGKEIAVETVKRVKRKTVDDSDTSQPDENERAGDSDNDVDGKHDDTQANQVSKTRRMIVGQRIMSSKPLQGRARDKEKTKTTRSSRRSHESKGNIDDTNRPPKSENKIVWDSFSGTKSIIAQSRYSQALMRKRRKILKQSTNSESTVLDVEYGCY